MCTTELHLVLELRLVLSVDVHILPQEYIIERVCNSHMVSTPAIWIGRRRQSAVNMLSCENTAVKRRAFAT